jgi:hypothetical protein
MAKSITDLSSFTRVGLDLAKHVFQSYDDSAPVFSRRAPIRAIHWTKLTGALRAICSTGSS